MLLNYFWYFFIYAFLGWSVEVVFAACARGHFENRGFLNGPVCPIYGFGLVLVVYLLNPVKDNFLVLFLGSAVLTSLMELVTGFVMEKAFHHRWWDYSKMPLNIGGYVCLLFSLAWGLACVFLIEIVHPSIAAIVTRIPALISYIVLPIFGATFIVDVLATVKTVLKLNQKLEELDKMAAQIKKMSNEIGEKISDKAIPAGAKVKELKEETEEKAAAFKQEAAEKLEALKAKQEQAFKNWTAGQKRLIQAFPTMHSITHSESFAKLAEAIKSKKQSK